MPVESPNPGPGMSEFWDATSDLGGASVTSQVRKISGFPSQPTRCLELYPLPPTSSVQQVQAPNGAVSGARAWSVSVRLRYRLLGVQRWHSQNAERGRG